MESSPGWGGQEIRILQEALDLRRRGHQTFFVVQKKSGLATRAKKEEFLVYEVDFQKRKVVSLFFFLNRLLKKHSIDVINTHSSLDSWVGGFVGKWRKIKVVRTRHLSTPIRKGLNSRWLYHKLTDFVVTTCQEIVPIIVEQSRKPSAKVLSIPTGINTDKIKPTLKEAEAFRKSLSLGKGSFLVGMVCFMRSWKGVEDFLQAAKLLEREENIHFVIIGGGHAKTYQDKAKGLQLKNLHFTGHLSSPYAAIQALDAFCLLSTAHEGVSQASLQAAFLKKPLITTETGGLKEVCLDQITGIRVPCFSPQKVAEAILQLRNNKDLCQKFGEEAHKLVVQKFTWAKTLKDMEEIYVKKM